MEENQKEIKPLILDLLKDLVVKIRIKQRISEQMETKSMSNATESIDFIITWVDGNDPIWQAEKARYQEKRSGDNRNFRYREWDTLRYWFRGVEKFAPWVNKVFFVTWGHLPPWLNTEHPKLKIVNHKDYIPAEYLPTFSSRTIDMNFHRIEDLSEHFVYFNDDMFLLQPTKKEDFFVNGLPCDMAVLDLPRISVRDRDGKTRKGDSIFLADIIGTAVINEHFKKKEVIKKHFFKWYSPKYGRWVFKTMSLALWDRFSNFRLTHVPYSYLKSTYSDVWNEEPDLLDSASRNKFRKNYDVNHWIFTYWQFAKGTFVPRRFDVAKYMYIKNDGNENLYKCIEEARYKMLCINDENTSDCYEVEKQKLLSAFEKILPEQSEYEK